MPLARFLLPGALVAALAASFAACSLGTGSGDTAATEEAAVLAHVGSGVIEPTYAAFAHEARALADAARRLSDSPTDSALADVRSHWLDTRVPWEQCEAFIFGPVTFNDLDPSLDSWPLNIVDLDALLAGDTPLTAETLGTMDETIRGFHGTEYVLWGPDGQKQATDLTPRERDYLAAATERIALDAALLHEGWTAASPDGGYVTVLATAGAESNPVYATRRDGIYELLMGVLFITDEVASEKLSVPLHSGTGRFAESRFSRSSTADIANNLRSVEHVLSGTYGGTRGAGLLRLVEAKDAAAAAQLQSELAAAQAAVAAIPVPLEEAVTTAPQAVADAKSAVERLKQTLEERVIPLVAPRPS